VTRPGARASCARAAPAIMPIETTQDEYGRYLEKRWRTVSNAHIVEIVDIDPPKSASRRKRAS
jgi:hypothetical protein